MASSEQIKFIRRSNMVLAEIKTGIIGIGTLLKNPSNSEALSHILKRQISRLQDSIAKLNKAKEVLEKKSEFSPAMAKKWQKVQKKFNVLNTQVKPLIPVNHQQTQQSFATLPNNNSSLGEIEMKKLDNNEENTLSQSEPDFSPWSEKRKPVVYVTQPQKNNSSKQVIAKNSQLLTEISRFNKKLTKFADEKHALWNLENIDQINKELSQQKVQLESFGNSVDKSSLQKHEFQAFNQEIKKAKKTWNRLEKMFVEKRDYIIKKCESEFWNIENLTIPNAKKSLENQLNSLKADGDFQSMKEARELHDQSIKNSTQDIKNPYYPETPNFDKFQRKIDTIANDFSSYIKTIEQTEIELKKSQIDDDNSKRQETIASITELTDIDTAADSDNNNSNLNKNIGDKLKTDGKNPLQTVDSQPPQVSASQNKDLSQINTQQHNLGQPIFNFNQTLFQKLQPQSDQPILNQASLSPSSVSDSSVPLPPTWINPNSVEKIPSEQDNTMYEGIENLYVSDEEKKLTEQFEKFKNKITEELSHTSSNNKTFYEELLSEVNKTIKDSLLTIDSKEAQTQLEKYNQRFNDIHALDNDLLNKILTDVPEDAPIRNQVTSIHKNILNKHFSKLDVKDENEQIHILQKAKSIEATEAALPQGTNDLASSLFAENQYRRILNGTDVHLSDLLKDLDKANRDNVLMALKNLGTKEAVDDVVKNINSIENQSSLIEAAKELGLNETKAKEYFVKRETDYLLQIYKKDSFVTQLLKNELAGKFGPPADQEGPDHQPLSPFSKIQNRKDFHHRIHQLKRSDEVQFRQNLEEMTGSAFDNSAELLAEKNFCSIYDAAGPKLQKILKDNKGAVLAELTNCDHFKILEKTHRLFYNHDLKGIGIDENDSEEIEEIRQENNLYILKNERLYSQAQLIHNYHELSTGVASNETSLHQTIINQDLLKRNKLEELLKRSELECRYKLSQAIVNGKEKETNNLRQELEVIHRAQLNINKIHANVAYAKSIPLERRREIFFGEKAKLVDPDHEQEQIDILLGVTPDPAIKATTIAGHLEANQIPEEHKSTSKHIDDHTAKSFNPRTKSRLIQHQFTDRQGQNITVVTSEKMRGGNRILEHHTADNIQPDQFKRVSGNLLPDEGLLKLATEAVENFMRNPVVARNGFTLKGEFSLGNEYVRAIMLVCETYKPKKIICHNKTRKHADVELKPDVIKAYTELKAQKNKKQNPDTPWEKKKTGFFNNPFKSNNFNEAAEQRLLENDNGEKFKTTKKIA